MTSSFAGIASYQKTNQAWQSSSATATEQAAKTAASQTVAKPGKAPKDVAVSEWKPISTKSPLVPTAKDGYGTVIGDVNLSDKAKDYYDKLKAKFHGMDFILVSKDMKSQVEANAAAYGNAAKPVVLIDDEKIERMANDENYRKKYEGIIAMSQAKLLEAKNSLTSSGANVKNFGVKVGEDGKMSFFATIEKANEAQSKMIEKRREQKAAAKAQEKKAAAKKAQEERIEKRREENRAAKAEEAKDETAENQAVEPEKEYLEFRADSMEDLINKVSRYAYDASARNVMTEAESAVGQSIDFKG